MDNIIYIYIIVYIYIHRVYIYITKYTHITCVRHIFDLGIL